MMTEERFEWLGLLSRKIVETDRLIEQERNSDVIDVPYLRDLKARAAELRAEAQRLQGCSTLCLRGTARTAP
jgi:hypothetical protein